MKLLKVLGALFCFFIVGLPIPWAFALTMNRVLPWIEISQTADKYSVAKFTVEKAFYNPGRGPKGGRSSWTVNGLIDSRTQVKIISSGHFYTGKIYKDTQELEAEFPPGKEITVLYNQDAHLSRGLQILNYRTDLSGTAARGIIKMSLMAYGPLLIDIILVTIWLRYKKQGNNAWATGWDRVRFAPDTASSRKRESP